MARTLSQIYQEAKSVRDQRLELTEFHNGSKMSVMDAFTWVTSACIGSFESLLDVFKTDVASDLMDKVNGTPAYYANALLKYQHGDSLMMNDEGTQFHYPVVDESKRIVTKVSYSEVSNETEETVDGVRVIHKFYDKDLVLKIATGTPGNYAQIDGETLTAIRSYMQQISFAGTHMTIVSRLGDILVPRLTVFYDGGLSASEMMEAIEASLSGFLTNLPFDGAVYIQKIIDAIQRTEHVTDVYIDPSSTDGAGIYVVQYDDNNNLIKDSGGRIMRKVDRFFIPNSGYVIQSDSNLIPRWQDTIKLVVEKPNTGLVSD